MTKRDKVLDTLRAAGDTGVTNRRLNDVCFRYSARLQELRDSGFQIETVRLKQGLFLYRLQSEPATSPRWETRSPQGERQPSGPAFDGSHLEGVGDTLFDMPTPRKSAVTGRDVQRRSEAA